jgi:para-aminobenzoate synthetase/4-amino-4-deoxychorismate lyase
MIAGIDVSQPVRVLVRDAASGRWLQFSHPREIVTAFTLADVAPGLDRVENAVARSGLCAAGFISYEAAPAFEPALTVRDSGGFPLLWFGLYDGVQQVDLPAPAQEPPLSRPSATLSPHRGERAGRGARTGKFMVGEHGVSAKGTAPGPDPGKTDWQASVGFPEFEGNLQRIKDLIRNGDTYQVNYTCRLSTSLAAEPWNYFLQLVAAQEAPYGAFVDTGEWVIGCASPELFFRLDGDHIACRPMKGTAARGLTQAQDRAQAETLRASEKEQAENVMIVDMVRHDLGRVAAIGSVDVPRLFTVEKYPTVWQMTSTIEARTPATLSHIFRALFPPASITGAPKVRTMEIIAQLETSARRIYTGTIGFIAPGRRAQFNVAIRTLLWNRQTRHAEYGVGGGITWGSQPEAEWQECRDKARILTMRVPAFSLLETMLWTPEDGYALLDRHLERLTQSALYFGFAVDLPAVRLELERLARTFHIRVAADVSRRHLGGGQNAPTDVGGYTRSANRAEREISGLAAHLARTRQKIRLLVTKAGRITLEAEALPAADPAPQRVAVAPIPADSSNPFLYHKTTNRGLYEAARAACPGYDDAVLLNEKGEVTESTIANVAVEIEGKLCTPPVQCGLLPGTQRADLLERGTLIERCITVEQMRRSPRVFLLNSVRGMYRVQVVEAPENNTTRS